MLQQICKSVQFNSTHIISIIFQYGENFRRGKRKRIPPTHPTAFEPTFSMMVKKCSSGKLTSVRNNESTTFVSSETKVCLEKEIKSQSLAGSLDLFPQSSKPCFHRSRNICDKVFHIISCHASTNMQKCAVQ